jgi:ABC-2 type transport system permease protein
LFAVSLAAAVMLSVAITMILQVSLLHQLSGIGVQQILPALVTLLSGMIVPLPMYPDFLQPFLRLQPMRGLCDVPYRIYSGDIAPPDALLEIGMQLGWLVLLVWFGRALLSAATRRVVIQGG